MTTLNVSWSSGNKGINGTILARKKKTVVKKIREKNISPNTFNSSDTKAVQKSNSNLSNQLDAEVDKTKGTDDYQSSDHQSTEGTTKLIKRKQKKDRISAKLLTKQGFIPTQSNVNNNQTHSLFSVGHKDLHVVPNSRGKSVVEKVFSIGKQFCDLEIHKYIVSNLEKNGFTTLTNIQEKSIPIILAGNNVLVRSQTGSGKTLAYGVPILEALQNINPRLKRSDGVLALIIVPTRELALQTHELFGKINTFQWIVVGHLCGGENRNTEKNRLRKGVHILIATPGRLLDHMLHTSAFKMDKVRWLVLDEADRLLDMGFKKDIVKIVEELDLSKTNSGYDPLALLRRQQHINNQEKSIDEKEKAEKEQHENSSSKPRQTILLSATLTKGIAELADFTMKEHTYIDTLDESANINSDMMVIPNTVKQKFIITHVKHRLFILSAMLLALSKKCSKMFVFMGTSSMVDYHYELFSRFLVKMPKNRGKVKSDDHIFVENEVDSDDEEEIVLDMEFFKLHGNMEQSDRKNVFTRFRASKTGVLICTDVVCRGIDVPSADCIIQYNGPQSIEDYLHRVGRTGRAGKSGVSYIFLTYEEQDFITKMESHKIFIQEQDSEEFLKYLTIIMDETNQESAATKLQKSYENALENDKDLHKLACMAYSSWSRFYNTYSSKMRQIFEFKNANIGHYVTSFGLKETPTAVARMLKGNVSTMKQQKFNKKLASHGDEKPQKSVQKRKIKSLSLTTSEYGSGLKMVKKKKKKNIDDE
ncbi:unnamed protein product [Phaedon cochleariae]|uniref:RNA helicase n=1 Tax=Phaedon cochleariae TaxID=80249 RepID=A0A9N9SLU0_PHACE|nr:unnamed protein product [Phaedon cochleariae]